MDNNILVIGSTGMLGQELCDVLDEKNIDYVGVGSKNLDITDKDSVNNFFEKYKPTIVFDCAAYTNVDGAEEEPGKTTNELVNHLGTKNIAEATEMVNGTLVYVSSDYVFDGTNESEYQENAETNPKNEYGRAKLAGESEIRKTCSKYYIIRTSWLYGKHGNNFVFTMLKLAKNHDELSVVNDQVGRPTWTKTLADFMLYSVENKIPFGTYQLSNEGTATWYDFASYILRDQDVKVNPVNSDAFPQKAYRPRHSIMSLKEVTKSGFTNSSWQVALDEFKSNI